MRRLLALATLAAAAAFFVPSSAQAGMNGCFGAPADYVAAFDQVRGQAKNGQVDYTYPTVYLEYQGWLTPSDGVSVPGHHSEHLHIGACLPNGVTLTNANAATRYIDARATFHNVQGYDVTSMSAGLVDVQASGPAFSASSAQLAELTAASHASGALETVNVYQSYTLSAPTSNGIKELRWHLITVRTPGPAGDVALVNTWRMNGRAYWNQQYTGLVARDPIGVSAGCKVDFVRTQNWIFYTGADGSAKQAYNYAGFGDSLLKPDCTLPSSFAPDGLKAARSGNWVRQFRQTDGSDSGDVLVDPNFHVHPDSWAWRADIPQPIPSATNISVTVPLGSLGLAPGVHRLMMRGHEHAEVTPSVKPISSSIVVMPFRVQ
jgi:hypothetical protein